MGEGLPISGGPSGTGEDCRLRSIPAKAEFHGTLLQIRKVLLRSLTKKHILLLNEIKLNDGNTITALLNRLSNESKMPLSTLKRNAFILRHLELIEYSDFAPARLTKAGELVLGMVGEKP